MSLAVVRCPACEGASHVASDAIGQMVGCPHCQSPFVAAEDAPEAPLPSRAGSKPPRGRPARTEPRPAAVIPIAPPRQSRNEPPRESPREPQSGSEPVLVTEVTDPEHDPHTPSVGGLPASVLVGFALMPFGIPLLWFVGPLLTGKEASLSIAVPVSLAVAAAALCLGVVYTIDWTAATRIKGVLMLVGLAYLTAAGLYFLKKDLMDRIQGFFRQSNEWGWVHARDGRWRVKMPRPAWPDEQRPLTVLGPESEARWARYVPESQPEQNYEYWFIVGAPDPDAREISSGGFGLVREQTWFACVGEQLKGKGGELVTVEPITYPPSLEANGRQWTFKIENGKTFRIVRVFAIKGRVYYLSAEGPGLTPDDEELAKPFFNSFEILPPKKK